MISAMVMLLALGLYLLAAVCCGASLVRSAPSALSPAGLVPADSPRPDASRLTRWARPLLFAGILAQFVGIGLWCVETHRSPFASAYGTLTITGWAIALAFAVVDYRGRMPAVGALALGVACLTLFGGVLNVQNPGATSPLLAQQAVTIHVLTIVASFGLFALAFGCAVLYLAQSRLLKRHRPGILLRSLPPLDTLDRVAYHCVAYGLPLLTLGLAFGLMKVFGGAGTMTPRQWLLDPKTLASFAIWSLYVFYLVARTVGGWRGVRLQYILIVGLVVALGLYLVPTHTHRFL